MTKDILLISELKNKKMLKIDVLMKKCYIDNIDSLVDSLFKIFNKELKHITGYTVFSDKAYLNRIFEYINVIIKQEDCNLLIIKTHLDESSSRIQKRLKRCSQEKYKKFLKRIYLSIQKSMLYIKDLEKENKYENASIELLDNNFEKINNFIMNITPLKTFDSNYLLYVTKIKIVFKNALDDENLSKDEVVERIKDSITKIEDKKLMIKGLPYCRKVRKFLNQLKNTFELIISDYEKTEQKGLIYTNSKEVIN